MILSVKAYKSGRKNTSHYLVTTQSNNGRRREYRYTNDDLPQTVKTFIMTHNFTKEGSGHRFF